MKKDLLLFLSVMLLISPKVFGQQDSTMIGFTPYGSFRGHFAVYDGEMEIQENASRIGFELSVYRDNVRYFAGTELGINLFRSPQVFNTDANTNSGFISIQDDQSRQVFTTRLGYLGADFGKFGVVTLGKQWGVYYDITGYTDKFNVFGGQGSATYVAASDGGRTGTGRSSQSLTYRNAFGNLRVGTQLSFQNVFNGNFVDGYGFSLQYEFLDGLRAGAAYNRSLVADFLLDNTLGMEADPEYLTFGLTYQNDTWDIGIVYADQTNGDLTEVIIDEDLVAAVFDAKGLEAFLKFKQPRYALTVGYNGYDPKVDELPVDPGFNVNYIVLGAEFKPSRFALVYSELRLTESTNQLGNTDPDVFTLGIRIDLKRSYSTYFK